MKIKQEHYKELLNAVKAYSVKENLLKWAEIYKTKNYSRDRFLWDIFWASTQNNSIRKELFAYLHDANIATVITKISKELNIVY